MKITCNCSLFRYIVRELLVSAVLLMPPVLNMAILVVYIELVSITNSIYRNNHGMSVTLRRNIYKSWPSFGTDKNSYMSHGNHRLTQLNHIESHQSCSSNRIQCCKKNSSSCNEAGFIQFSPPLLKHRSMSSLLFQELIEDILSRLPVKSLVRFRCVCKSWLDLIRNPRFVRMHLKRAKEKEKFKLMGNDHERVYCLDSDVVLGGPNEEVAEFEYPLKNLDNQIRIWGSCNGLLCIAVREYNGDETNCIWNPSTKEYKILATAPIETFEGYEMHYVICGFGYDRITDDYKFVIIVFHELEGDDSSYFDEVMVYTLGTDSWRKIADSPYDFNYIQLRQLPGVHVNGALHWAAFLPNGNDNVLVSLDLADEEYREVPQPNYSDNDFDLNVGLLEACLCVIRKTYNAGVDVWMMKEYGVKESWVKLFTIAQPTYIEHFHELRLVKIEKNGEILVNDENKMFLAYFDPKSGRIRLLEIRGFLEAYVEGLVSLHSGTFVGQA